MLVSEAGSFSQARETTSGFERETSVDSRPDPLPHIIKSPVIRRPPIAELMSLPRFFGPSLSDYRLCTASQHPYQHHHHNPPPSPPLQPLTSTLSILAMAASLRPTLMRQAFAAPTQRTLTSAVLPAFRVQRSQPILKSIPRATFQTSAARHILPPLPQVIKGGVNDPVTTPTPHPAHGSYHWSFERCDDNP